MIDFWIPLLVLLLIKDMTTLYWSISIQASDNFSFTKMELTLVCDLYLERREILKILVLKPSFLFSYLWCKASSVNLEPRILSDFYRFRMRAVFLDLGDIYRMSDTKIMITNKKADLGYIYNMHFKWFLESLFFRYCFLLQRSTKNH